MRRTWKTFTVLFSLTLCATYAAAASDRTSGRSTEARPDYIIQASDILEIFVWREPELSRKVVVRPDGKLSFPLLQDIQAAGLTPVQLKEQIEQGLGRYINAPNATVIVDAIQHYKIYVVGKVQKPGLFIVDKPISVMQAISLAGGLQEFAKETDIAILRRSGGEQENLRFDYRSAIKGNAEGRNIDLRPGDVVVVP